ncbi:MAG: sulfurtransferase-like selenium metabolism protein YedF [Firmicutes bacterium]|nr:sulfurtransferase-like selenium metabolism protein YedF [Bacillota bacterium]
MADIIVNAVGQNCPIPVVMTTKELNAVTEAGTVVTHVDNEVAVQNLLRLASSKGLEAKSEKLEEKLFAVTIVVNGPLTEEVCEECECAGDARENTVVVVSSDRMGEGNDELGKVLIKGFIYAVSQLPKLPKTVIFYNGGATLPVEGSASLEDLKNLEAQGVEILTCGTCLDYYSLKEKLAVGSVTNMYTIVETIANATKVIKP